MINWNQIDTVLLDMDGTLLDLHYDNYFWLQHLPRRYARRHNLDEQQARERLFELFDKEKGTLNWYCVDYWSDRLDVDIEALKKEIKHLIALRPYVEEFLRLLHDSPREVLLVTNAHAKSMNLKMAETEIGQYFNHIVCSHDFHCPKEDPAFWPLLQQKHYFDPQRTLFIDDSAAVLESAESFGIRYLLTLLQPDSKLAKRELTQYPGFHHFDSIMPDITDKVLR